MVLRDHKKKEMAAEQPVKKKPRRGDDSENSRDEPDFISTLPSENGVSALHLSLPVDVNEDDISLNTVNTQLCGDVYRTSEQNCSDEFTSTNITTFENISMQPAPDIILSSLMCSNFENSASKTVELSNQQMIVDRIDPVDTETFLSYLVKQCLCDIPDNILRKPFESYQITDENGSRTAMLSEWSTGHVLQFLSSLQLLFEVYLKQNNSGHICSKIVTICNTFVRNEHNLIEQIISLCETRDKYVIYLAGKVFSSFLIIAKTNINNEWLETIVSFLTIENSDYGKMNFALEIIKRVVEWKDVDLHVLEEPQNQDGAGSSSSQTVDYCIKVPYSDVESYDTSGIKGLIIKSLEAKWPELTTKIQYLISQNSSIQTQTCILTFLNLWESTISVKANLSIIDIKPFYAHLETFVGMLNNNLPPIIWKQLLSLFNEVLCYGSTLALQDMLPEDTCQLAHLIVRYVKDFRLLDCLPYRRCDGYTVNSFVGTIPSIQPDQSNIDKTLLQKMTLLVLKSVAITIKETRSDSSDSSVGSEDYDFSHDMQLIARSIRDVLKKVDIFLKASLEFHPETPFSKILIRLFSDQDDYMIESMVCTLDIITGISYQNVLAPDFLAMLNPVHSFIEFLKIVSHDSDVLLDYLVSNETCFLLYLLRFLKYTKKNWDSFVHSCYEGGASRTNELDNTMTVLIRLKMQINRLVSRGLFPYNIDPVFRLLGTCENLYDGNEYS